VTILTYHGFTDKSAFDGVIDHQRMRLHVDAFRRHVEHLVTHYRVFPLSSVLSLLREGRKFPKRGVVITFDDGYRSCYTLAYPVLKEFDVPASLFVATDFVYERKPLWHDRVEYAVHATHESMIEFEIGGQRRSLRCATIAEKLSVLRAICAVLKRVDHRERDVRIDELESRTRARLELSGNAPPEYWPTSAAELREMASGGLVEVGSHTKSHAILSRCSLDELRGEVLQSKKAIEDGIGIPCDLFCYPNGTRNDLSDDSRSILVETGYRCALTTIPGRNGANADPMELRRIGAPADSAEFSVAVSGVRAGLALAYGAVKQAIGRRAVAE